MHISKSNLDKAGNDNMSDAKEVNTQLNRAPVFTSQAKASNITRTSMNISAVATDQDTSDTLTYTFYWGTSASNLSLVASNTSGVFPRTDLNMNTTYWFRIDVTDGIDTTPGTANSAATLANRIPSIGTPSVSRVENSTDKLTISVSATDTDDTAFTYTLWRGTTSSNISKTNITITGNSGNTVTFTDTGLAMNTTYYYKVRVSDAYGGNDTSANYGNERTYCAGTYCGGGTYTTSTCNLCNGNKTLTCNTCNGSGTLNCLTCSGSTWVNSSCIGSFNLWATNTSRCGSCDTSGRDVSRYTYRCSICKETYDEYICHICGWTRLAGTKTHTAIQIRCTSCSGSRY